MYFQLYAVFMQKCLKTAFYFLGQSLSMILNDFA